jgi:hypothetical protein
MALAKAGLKHIRQHDLRHTAATLMLTEGIHRKIVREMLGRANIFMILTTYSHVLATLQRDAVDRLDLSTGQNSPFLRPVGTFVDTFPAWSPIGSSPAVAIYGVRPP